MDKRDAKLRLSAEEMRLVTDPVWILTKNSIMEKAVAMLARLSEEWRERMEAMRMEGSASAAAGRMARLPVTEPRISRGENYRGLPWVMMDYPRVFGREDVFAVRTMFLWGYAFNVMLHLKGEYMRVFIPVIRAGWKRLEEAGFQAGISDEEWRHEHTAETYGEWAHAGERPFLKLSAKCGLERWEEAPEILTALFVTLLGVLSA